MSDLTAYVASSSLEIKDSIIGFLDMFGYTVVGNTQYGFDCVNEVLEKQPDVLLTDAYIYDLSAIDLIERLREFPELDSTAIVLISKVNDSSLINRALSAGVDIFTLLPTDFISLDKRIREYIDVKKADTSGNVRFLTAHSTFAVRKYLLPILARLGIATSLKGHTYLCDSVVIVINDKKAMSSLKERVYPAIAALNDTTGDNVEHNIRTAIEKGWRQADLELINEMFGYTVGINKKGPSNAQLIAALAEKVKIDLGIII